MYPILFKIGSTVFYSYHVMIMVGVMVTVAVGVRLCRQFKIPVVSAFDLGILGIISGFIGGRVGHLVFEVPGNPKYIAYYAADWLRALHFWQGGYVSFGAYVFVLGSFYFYLRWKKQAVWATMDATALVAPIALLFGRGGCLLNGCCFGAPTDFFLHLTFHHPASTAYHFHPHIALHATQIYLMLNAVLIGVVLWTVYKKCYQFQGQLLSLLFLVYPVGRFLIEYLRGDVARGFFFNGLFSSGQLVMIGFFMFGLVCYYYFHRRGIAPRQDATTST